MTKTFKTALLAFTSFALLSGCSDDGSSSQTSWVDWLMGKDNNAPVVMVGFATDDTHETQAGNFLAGQFAQYRQDWTTAHTYLDNVIAFDPKNMELAQRSMLLAMQGGNYTRALGLARKVLEIDRKNLLALLFVATDEISTQNYMAAQKTIAKIPPSNVSDYIKPILLSWMKAHEKKVDLDSMVANGSLQAYHALLIEDYIGKVNDPQKYFVNVLATGGADKHMVESMADVFARQGHKDLAIKIYDTLLKEEEKNSIPSSHSVTLKQKLDNPEKVTGLKIETPAQGVAEVFYNMARILYQDQSDESALVFIRLSEQLDPHKENVKILMAAMMVRANHIDEAIKIYQSITMESPVYSEAQRSAAELLEKEGKIDESIALLESQFTATKDVNNIIQIGDVYRRAEKHNDAIKAYDRAIDFMRGKVSSDYWSLLFSRGMSYEQIGDLKKSEEDLIAALEFQPNNPYLLNYLGYSWVDQGKKLEESLKMIERAVALKPDDGYIVDSLGWAYFKLGRFEDSVIEMEKAVELVPFDPTINDHLGDAYWKVGRKNEARFQWARAINHTKDAGEIAKLEQKITGGLHENSAPLKQAQSHNAHDQTTNTTPQ